MISYFNGIILYPLLEKASGRNIHQKLHELQAFDALTNHEKRLLQKKYLIKMLEFSQANCPYYKNLFNSNHFEPDLINKDLRYFYDLPELTKEIILENLHQIRQANSIHPRKTGGSTGPSVFFFYDNDGIDWTAAINLMCYKIAGKMSYHNDLHIGADIELSPPGIKDKIKHKLKLFAQNRTAALLKSFSQDDLLQLLILIKKTRPYLIQGHPSTLYALANYVEQENLQLKLPLFKIFEPSGEMMTDKIFAKINKVLGCDIFNRYGNAEFGVTAHSIEKNNIQKLKAFDRAFVHENNSQGDLIITNLTNYGMPLIRYNTGDMATVVNQDDGTYVQNITGRVHDSVSLNGHIFPSHIIMDYLDHKVGGIQQFQIVLNYALKPVLNIIAQQAGDEKRIQSLIEQKWPGAFEIHFVDASKMIQTGWRLKFRHIIDVSKGNT